jgi:hypothetical protein
VWRVSDYPNPCASFVWACATAENLEKNGHRDEAKVVDCALDLYSPRLQGQRI